MQHMTHTATHTSHTSYVPQIHVVFLEKISKKLLLLYYVHIMSN